MNSRPPIAPIAIQMRKKTPMNRTLRRLLDAIWLYTSAILRPVAHGSELCDRLCEVEVELREPSGVVRRQLEAHGRVAHRDVRVVVAVLGLAGDGVHEADRVGERVEP